MAPLSAHHAPAPEPAYLDGRDVAAVLFVRVSELAELGIPVLPVSARRLLVSVADLDAWERARAPELAGSGPGLSWAASRRREHRDAERLLRSSARPRRAVPGSPSPLREEGEDAARDAASLP